jgi:hypothetical protein
MPMRLVVADTGPINSLVLIGLLDLATAIARLKATNFRYPPELIEALLAQHREEKS